MLNRRAHSLFLVLVFAGFAWGVYSLFSLRFEAGDFYPPYSSFRKDPLGAGVFYQGLEKLENITVERNHDSFSRFRPKQPTVLFIAGASGLALAFERLKELGPFVAGGGRLVITLYPEKRKGEKASDEPEKSAEGQAGGHEEKKCLGQKPDPFSSWGLALDPKGAGRGPDKAYLKNLPDAAGLPVVLSWPSEICFAVDERVWKVVYAKENSPVVVTRRFGNGSIVAAADSFFLSNEGLSEKVDAGFLSWLVGNHGNVVFDESLKGARKTWGIASLAVKYRLAGLAAGLFFFVALLIWKLSARLVPASACQLETEGFSGPGVFPGTILPGRDHRQGLVSLLHRKIPEKRILKTCVNEWKKSNGWDPARIADMERALAGLAARADAERGRMDPVSAWRAISQTLSEGRSK